MKVFIDPGHGGTDPGGSLYNNEGMPEKDINLDIAQGIQCILTERGYDVKMSRTEDVYISLVDRVNMANEWFADFFISVHCNSVNFESANGIETLYYPTSTSGKAFAQEVQEQLILQTNRVDRGIKPRDLYVLRKTRMPAILPECGFMTNKTENELLNQSEFRTKCARAIADGFTQYVNMK